jgi:hypothetical protein
MKRNKEVNPTGVWHAIKLSEDMAFDGLSARAGKIQEMPA